MKPAEFLEREIHAHTRVLEKLQQSLASPLTEVLEGLHRTLAAGGKILVCGNGGSAADAQHFVAELIGGPKTLPAIALTTDTSILTALGNDYGWDEVFARQVTALGQPGDSLLAISTSGYSPNVLRAATAAHRGGLEVVGLTGELGGDLAPLCHRCLRVPSRDTQRIQEMHCLLLHTLWRSLLALDLPAAPPLRAADSWKAAS